MGTLSKRNDWRVCRCLSGPQRNNPALHLACSFGHADVVKVLVQEGKADVNATNNVGGAVARTCGTMPALTGLTRTRFAMQQHVTPLHKAAHIGLTSAAKVMLEAGANPNARDQFGQTPLHYAVSAPHADVARELIAAGADVDAKDDTDFTPLICACMERCDADCVKMLLDAGANREAETRDAWRPMHFAARWAAD